MSDDKRRLDGSFVRSIIPPPSKPKKDGIPLSDLSERDKPWDVHRAESDRIEQHYQGTEFQSYADRIHFCSDFLDFILAPHTEGELRLKLYSARFCRVRTCMVCCWRKSLRWKAKAYQMLPRFIDDHPAYRFLFLTLTVKNCEIWELRETLDWMNKGFTRLSRLKAFPGEGWIKSVEVTKGRRGDAHPHFHVLLGVKASYFGRNYLSQKKWVEFWQKSLRCDYKPILDVQALKSKDSLVGLVAEVIKYQTKPTNLIGHGRAEDRDWFLEYTRQMHNTKAISVGGIFRDYFRELEKEPEDLIGRDENSDDLDEGHLYFGWKRKQKKYKLID
ncbi:MAG: protein rep [Okeania sp. SIO2C9]|uniref:protein rep n=1 Tax=Okeania sp. SIO2C9 TaxID=2607791 RepID=UPI0013BF2B00|nr:protein rep [Okeania sp. SIO2C9]NEQ78473.1 protein rep [Okeania sp. SIO2C9]